MHLTTGGLGSCPQVMAAVRKKQYCNSMRQPRYSPKTVKSKLGLNFVRGIVENAGSIFIKIDQEDDLVGVGSETHGMDRAGGAAGNVWIKPEEKSTTCSIDRRVNLTKPSGKTLSVIRKVLTAYTKQAIFHCLTPFFQGGTR
jgi:hypothetical protein